MTSTEPQPGWYPDPSGQHGLRWWDGKQWTENVAPQQPEGSGPGQPAATPPAYGPTGQPGTYGGYQPGPQQVSYGAPITPPPPPVTRSSGTPDRIQRQVREQARAAPVFGGGGTLFTEPILVVNQKTKIIEVTNEYAVYDQHGTQIGSVVEVGQGVFKKIVRFLGTWDQFFTHRLEVRDVTGVPQLMLVRPPKVFKSRIRITLPSGQLMGEIVQENVFGKIRFGFQVNGQKIGSINAENWRAWNFSIQDAGGQEIARITKTWEGLARTLFTTADNYVVQIHRPLEEPLRSMVIASALTVDTALKQDSRGGNSAITDLWS
jgi:uncharacterized protein YxjI